MNVFFCGNCGARLHFENTTCLSCGCTVGYAPSLGELIPLDPAGGDLWRQRGLLWEAPPWRMCDNYSQQHVCNWLVPSDSPSRFCIACELNRTIPDLSVPENHGLWSKIESAKRRLIYTLLKLNLPVIPKSADLHRGLAFDFLAEPDPEFSDEDPVITAHAGGVITLNIAEADDAVRERMRLNLREVYRTLLGHFRHESGHYYWDLLVRDHPRIHEVRACFGDERLDYTEALERHYAGHNTGFWADAFVTPYAGAHPWEDWAETWAHYLHIMDTLQTAASQGVEIHSPRESRRIRDPFNRDFESVLEDFHALRVLLNSLNRSMGLNDAYPFVISTTVASKLAFIHRWISSR